MDAPPRKALKVGFALFIAAGLVLFVMSYIGVYVFAPGGGERVGLVRLEGPILDARELVDTIRSFQKDDAVRALVLRVDSPGGGVVPSQEIHDAVAAFKASGKSVVTSMGTVAASGGYYAAVPSDLIVANPGTLTGSIGVIMSLTNLQELMGKVGVSNITIKAGKNKDIGSPFRPMTAEERELLQGLMDDIHSQFIEAVANGRGRPVDEIRPLADGRVFTGRQAVELGLVDELGNLQEAIKRAGELAGIEGTPRVVERRKSPLERLFGEVRSLIPWPTAGPGGLTGMRALYLMAL